MYTTLNRIRERRPCTDLWETLLKYLGKTQPDDEPLSLLTILDSNGLNDALWCFRAVDGFEKEKLLLGIGFARDVEHLMPDESKKSLDVFERYANGLATKKKFEAARRAAADAADAAWGADASHAAAARAAAHAAAAAAYAARTTVYAAARTSAAAWTVARAAAPAADAASNAVVAALAATRSTIQAKQETQLRELLERTK